MKKHFITNLLTDQELASLKGGVLAATCFHCTCSGTAGEWYAKYDSSEDIVNSISSTCINGGGTGSCEQSTSSWCDVIA